MMCMVFIFTQENVRKHQSEGSLEDVLECFNNSFPFDGLESEYFQRKYYKENLNLLVS